MYSAQSVYGTSDTFYYNAVLSNPNVGDVTEIPARFFEQRQVPLLTADEAGDWSVALARLGIIGSTANLPVLVPTVNGTSGQAAPMIETAYEVGVQYTLWTTANPATAVAVSKSALYTDALRIPSVYPDDTASTTDSKFYWVTTGTDVVTALNRAVSRLMQPQTWQTSLTSMPFVTTGAAGGVSGSVSCSTGSALNPLLFYQGGASPEPVATNGMPGWWYFTLDKDTYKICMHVAVNPYLPTELAAARTVTMSATTYYLTADIYFNDKLLELFPLDTLFPYSASLTAANNTWGGLPRAPYTDYQTVYTRVFGTAPTTVNGFYPLNVTQDVVDIYVQAPTNSLNFTHAPGGGGGGGSAYQSEVEIWQEYEATSAWSVYTGMTITSSMICAYAEAGGTNSIASINSIQSPGVADVNILFDFDLTQDTLHQIQRGIGYVPNVFRYSKLRGGQALTGIDLYFYLRTRDGRYVPWMVTNGGTISAKFMFTKKPH
jgi:hypothetical protein